jgi:hypothetical protein
MESSETALEAAARKAYERGRRRLAGRAALLVLPVAMALPLLSTEVRVAALSGILLVATTFVFALLGGLHFRALVPGIASGGVAWLLPSLPRCAAGMCPLGTCLALCMGGAFLGGLVAGLVLAGRAQKETSGQGIFLASAAWVALLLGASGCIVAGGWGIVGLLVGGLAGTSRVLIGARAS